MELVIVLKLVCLVHQASPVSLLIIEALRGQPIIKGSLLLQGFVSKVINRQACGVVVACSKDKGLV